jgi:hypothetical protein
MILTKYHEVWKDHTLCNNLGLPPANQLQRDCLFGKCGGEDDLMPGPKICLAAGEA